MDRTLVKTLSDLPHGVAPIIRHGDGEGNFHIIGRIFSCVDMEPQWTLLGRVVRVVSVQVAQLVVCVARSCLYSLTQDRCLLAPSGVKFL